jgi:hypothetical protein
MTCKSPIVKEEEEAAASHAPLLQIICQILNHKQLILIIYLPLICVHILIHRTKGYPQMMRKLEEALQ